MTTTEPQDTESEQPQAAPEDSPEGQQTDPVPGQLDDPRSPVSETEFAEGELEEAGPERRKSRSQVSRLLRGEQKRPPSPTATRDLAPGPGGEHQLKGLFGEENTIEAGERAGAIQRKLAAVTVEERRKVGDYLSVLDQTPNPRADEAAEVRAKGTDAVGVEIGDIDALKDLGDGGTRDWKGDPVNSNYYGGTDREKDAAKAGDLNAALDQNDTSGSGGVGTVQTDAPVIDPETGEPVNEGEGDDLDGKTVDDLKGIAKDEGVKGYSQLNKDDLVRAIRDHRSEA